MCIDISRVFKSTLDAKILHSKVPFVPAQRMESDGKLFRLTRVYAYNDLEQENKAEKVEFSGLSLARSSPILVGYTFRLTVITFFTGKFPEILKLNKYVPVPKKTGKILLSDLRPIALTSFFFLKSLNESLLSA